MYNGRWKPPPATLALADDEVHVWRISLNQPQSVIADLRTYLEAAELERAARYFFDKDRYQYIIGRGVLRLLLGRYLGQPAAGIRFQYTGYNKPFLDPSFAPFNLHFNLSHSGKVALLAFARHHEVGVDVELIRTDMEHSDISENFFSPYEVSVLRSVSSTEQPLVFFNCWTRKEAYIKAQGQGLSLALDSFDVTMRPDEPTKLLAIRDQPDDAAAWTLMALHPGVGYVGALAIRAHGLRYQLWEWMA